MNIALCHYRVGETDGVSLEMDKWKRELEKMGHNVYLVAGSIGSSDGYIIPELHYKSKINDRIRKNVYEKLEDYKDEDELRDAIIAFAVKIDAKLEKFVKDYKIDLLIPNNIWSLGWSLSAGIAFYSVAKKLGIRCIAHHHDFYWEREKSANSICKMAEKLLENYFPPKDDLIEHVVINRIAKREMFKRKRIEASIVPNVFDFKGPLWKVDDYNKDFREAIGVADNDILVLQATRVTERKALELAIDVIGQMQAKGNFSSLRKEKLYNDKKINKNSRIVYVLAGLPEGESKYIELLKKKAAAKNVNMIFINDIIEHSRCDVNGKKCYSLWDAYAHADIVTYPSIVEGWGNQFLEAAFAKKPIITYEYPVYITDIKYKMFNVISLGHAHEVDREGLVTVEKSIIKDAAKQAVQMLINKKMRDNAVERNFEICSKFFSCEKLHELLSELI